MKLPKDVEEKVLSMASKVSGPAPAAKPSKYRNRKTVVDGVRFDSEKEAKRWMQLRMAVENGRISGLQRQVAFILKVNGILICRYKPDFVYVERSGKRVVEDVKSKMTASLSTYKIKKALMKAIYDIDVKEV